MPQGNPLAYFQDPSFPGQAMTSPVGAGANVLVNALFGEIPERPNAVKPSLADFGPDELAQLANDDERRKRAGFTVSEVEGALMQRQAPPARNSAAAQGTPTTSEKAAQFPGAAKSAYDMLNEALNQGQ